MIYRLGERVPVFAGRDHFIAPGAQLIGSVRLHDEVSIWFNAVLRGDNDWIDIGPRSNVQDGAILHTDPGYELTLGSGVTVGHRAMLHGCRIGDDSLVGIGSTILNGAQIGQGCLVGAHALVTEDKEYPDGVLLLGSPAKIARELSESERQALKESAAAYVQKNRRYRDQLHKEDSVL